jgi:hypothetical protein
MAVQPTLATAMASVTALDPARFDICLSMWFSLLILFALQDRRSLACIKRFTSLDLIRFARAQRFSLQ